MSENPKDSESNRETELKLAVSADVMAKLRSDPAITARAKGRAVTRTLESTYFDTPDFSLDRRKVALRVRRSGENFIQTLKGAVEGNGLLARGEWEWPVTGPEPDLALVVDDTARALLGAIDPDTLRPVFTTVVKRTIRNVERTNTRIEVAFDSGELRTPDGATLPLSEVELELKAGEAGALYDLALDIANAAPVRVESRSKSARGYALAAGTLDGSSKADKLAMNDDMTVEGALTAIVRSCLIHMSANVACALVGTDPEGVHQIRVATRRLRSAITLFRPLIPQDSYDWLVGELRWLGGYLGPARDWDVFIAELLDPVRSAMQTAGNGILAGDLDLLEAAAQRRRAQAYDAVREVLSSSRHASFQLRLGAWLESRGWRNQPVNEHSVRLFESVAGLADHLLDRRHRKARKMGRGFERLRPEARHQLRIALKKLRYAAEFFQTLYDEKASRRYILQLAKFQDALGHLNDVATATRLLQDLHAGEEGVAPGEARAAGIVLGWHARGIADTEDSMVALWSDFADTRPFWPPPVIPGTV